MPRSLPLTVVDVIPLIWVTAFVSLPESRVELIVVMIVSFCISLPRKVSTPNSKNSQTVPAVIEKQNENRHTKIGERLNLTFLLRFKISVSPNPTPAQIKPFSV